MPSLCSPRLTIPSGSFQQNVHPQLQSPLFAVLPAEIRVLIFTYTLTDSDELVSMDSPDALMGIRWNPWMPIRTTTSGLLRTCKRALQETWFMPFTLTEHQFASHMVRIPDIYRCCNPTYAFEEDMRAYSSVLQTFANAQTEMPILQIPKMRVWLKDRNPRKALEELFNVLMDFKPECVTLDMSSQPSLRKATPSWVQVNRGFFGDSYHIYENQLPEKINWPFGFEFPVSVNTIKVEMNGEYVLDHGVDEYKALAARSNWCFRRADGVKLKVSKFEKCLRTQNGFMSAYDQKMILKPRGLNTHYITGAIWTFTPELASAESENCEVDRLSNALDSLTFG